jgi:LysM repeat protein
MKKWLQATAIVLMGSLLLTQTAWGASYTVQSGDSLWSIANHHKVKVNDLKQHNNLSGDLIYPGQVLLISPYQHYTVRTHTETLWTISKTFGVPLEAVVKANPALSNPNNIWPGLVIRIPLAEEKTDTTKPWIDGVFPYSSAIHYDYSDDYGDGRSWTEAGVMARKHEGVDIFAAIGTPILSATDGVIIRKGWSSMGGWRITIRSGNIAYYYAHLSGYSANIKLGDRVTKGQLIGYTGDSGYGPEGTTGQFVPHLHFGMYDLSNNSWVPMNPYPYLKNWESRS